LEELTETVESADHLTRIGEPEEALRVVERQRARLFGTVETISRAISAPGKDGHPIRRNLVLLAAAITLALSGIGISLASLTTKTDDPATHLRRAAGISDPVQRLNALYDVYQSTARENPAAIAVGTKMNKQLKAAIAKNADDLQADPREHHLVDKAHEWVNDLTTGAPLTPPATPSTPTSPSPAPSPSTPQPPSTPKTSGVPSPGVNL
jgi:hypothetical protein